ncbi:hypothetical protein BDN70DRAFT_353742 [Pholiota conissans]|uniref:Uncharacterized protein n=1 Tax=Pholiota conissans TaxID=109636 RepID=A0A9P5YQ56_9AGAR|nr:hypothetical protein BDN70DRAFT_353742 [Pholiota conissans]
MQIVCSSFVLYSGCMRVGGQSVGFSNFGQEELDLKIEMIIARAMECPRSVRLYAKHHESVVDSVGNMFEMEMGRR